MTNFERALYEWMRKNGINCGIELSEKFAYNLDNNTILIAEDYDEEMGVLSEQFFYEYGAEFIGYGFYVFGLLHEIGHYFTISSFDVIDQMLCNTFKALCEGDNVHDHAFRYWEIPDEFAANVWAINFINEHTAAVNELANIFNKEFYNVD